MGKIGQFFKTKGIFLAAGLCVVAAGVAGVGAINRMIDNLQPAPLPDSASSSGAAPNTPREQESETTWHTEDIQETPVGKTESGVPKADSSKASSASSSQRPSAPSPSDSGQTAAPPSVLPDISAPRFVKPVDGEVTAAFSGNELLYNETMDDWRTHNGTDFAAAYGEEVRSVTAGTVKTVQEDPLWGWMVEIEGADGLLRYTGLARKPAVKAGEAVEAGDVIGKLDELSAEIALEPHLHVEYEKDGALCDVMDLLAG